MTTFAIQVGANPPFPCPGDERVLIAMERAGRHDIPVGCRGGGCGLCKVQVETGSYSTGRMSRAHISIADEAARIALACRIFPASDLRLTALMPQAGLA